MNKNEEYIQQIDELIVNLRSLSILLGSGLVNLTDDRKDNIYWGFEHIEDALSHIKAVVGNDN